MIYLLVFKGEGVPSEEYFHLSSYDIPTSLTDQYPSVLFSSLSILDGGKTRETFVVYVKKIRESEIKKRSLYDSKVDKIIFVI